MSYQPCKNPNCKSYGAPHPNCRCYGEMADGGEVDSFCSIKRAHQKGCEYFAEGGEVPEDDLPVAEEGDAPIEMAVPVEDFPDGNEVPVEDLPDNAEVPTEDLPQLGLEVPKDDLPTEIVTKEDKYSSLPQKAAAFIEGMASGIPVLGPAITAGEIGLSKAMDFIPPESGLHQLGLAREDIQGRKETNPELAAAGNVIGSFALPMGKVASYGQAALKGLLAGMTIQGSNEANNWVLGDTDPEAPITYSILNTGAGGLFGLGTNMASLKATRTLTYLANKDIGPKLTPFLEGIAAAAKGNAPKATSEEGQLAMKLKGAKFYNAILASITPSNLAKAGSLQGAYEGYSEEGLEGIPLGAGKGALKGAAAGLFGKHVVDKATRAVGENAVGPFLANLLSSGTVDNIGSMINYASDVTRGFNKLNKGMENVFKGVAATGITALNALTVNENRERLKNYIAAGGFSQDIDQAIQDQTIVPDGGELLYAEGGEVMSQAPQYSPDSVLKNENGLALHYPLQDLAMNVAKTRISSYLQSQRPQANQPRLPFDEEPDLSESERHYDRALDIANAPLGILEEIENGTLEHTDLAHLQAMYPEAHQLMQQQASKHIVESQLAGTTPPYHVQQSLSLFMGMPLTSELLPQSMQAIQQTFQMPESSQNGQAVTQKSSSSLAKADDKYLTNAQARTQRRQK